MRPGEGAGVVGNGDGYGVSGGGLLIVTTVVLLNGMSNIVVSPWAKSDPCTITSSYNVTL